LIFAAIFASFVLNSENSKGASGWSKRVNDARRIWRVARMRHKTKVGIGFYQCLAAVPGVFNLTIPVGLEHYTKWLDVLELPADLDDMLVPGSCMGGYRSRLWFGSMWPIVLVAFFASCFVGYEFHLQRSRGAVDDEERARGAGAVVLAGLQRCLPLALGVSFVVVPSASMRLFQTFRCDSFQYDVGEVREYLHDDYTLNCQSDEYDATRSTAAFLLLIWPVGIPLLYAALLYASRKALLKGMRTTLSDATHFLSGDYEATKFWWEPVEMCRKLLLTGWLLLVDSTAEQTRVVVALLLSIFFLMLRLAVKPLANGNDEALSTTSEVSLILLYISVLIIKACTTSTEVCETFGFGESSEGIFLFFVFFGVSMLIVLLAVYIAAGSWQAAKEFALYDKVYRDVITQLVNKRRFDEVQYELQESGAEAADRVRYWSIDIQGFKAVNDRISHDVGDKALGEYGRLLPDVIYKCLGESGVVSTMEKPIVFRTGGDELAVVCVKSPTASFPDFEAQIATMVRTVAETVLFDAKRDGAAPESEWVPTFLRIGVASTFKLADEAETAVRTDIYRKAFGSLDARGMTVKKSELDDKGVRTWEIMPSRRRSIASLQADAAPISLTKVDVQVSAQ